MARQLSAEHRAAISRGGKRAHVRRRFMQLVRPAHVDAWLRAGLVAEPLRPILAARARHVEAMVADLGGVESVSAMELRALEGWFQAQVLVDAEWQRYVRGDANDIPERLLTAINSARASLSAVGLERRAVDVTPGLDEYLSKRGDGAGRENGSDSDAVPAPAVDRSAGDEGAAGEGA